MIGCINFNAARPTINNQDASELRLITKAWSERRGTIPKHEWPKAIHRLRPENVYGDDEGLYIQRGSFFVTASGWFILSSESTFCPNTTGDPSYQLLHERGYWYTIEG